MRSPEAEVATPIGTEPLVSILLLTWNHERYIRAAIESMLAESYRNVEIICCENGSSDGTWRELQSVVAQHPDRRFVTYQNPPGTPVNVGFNGMLRQASGDLVCFFSGDDLFCGDRLARQVAAFQADPDLKLVYGNGAFLGGRNDGTSVHDDREFADVFTRSGEDVLRFVFAHRSMMIQALLARRSLIEAIGGFDEQEIADDWILNIRMFEYLRDPREYAYQPLISFLYRQHENNAYKNFPRQSRMMLDVIDRYYRFPDRRKEMADMYYFQVNVGAMYGFRHLGLTLSYLREALKLEVRPKGLIQFLARFVLARPLRLYRRVRDARRSQRQTAM